MIHLQTDVPAHPADLGLWNTTKAGVEVQMLSAGQQLVYGIELRAVPHVLVDVQDVGQNTERRHSEKDEHKPLYRSPLNCEISLSLTSGQRLRLLPR